MAIVQAYPLGTPKANDLVVGTSIPAANTNEDPKTVNFSVGDIVNLAVTGSGTLNTIPLWTPNGQKIGDSIITQSALGQGVTVTGQLDVTADFNVSGSTQLNSALTVEEVATFNDEVECNNNVTVQGIFSADGNSIFEGQANFQSSVTDQTSSPGAAGQVLSSTGTNVEWVDAAQTTEITITNAQLRTIGTVPVEILPIVSGYTYQILDATAQAINTGSLNDEYDWSSQSGVISSRTNSFATIHRVEIPESELPSGGTGVGAISVYVATPISGSSRVSSKVYATVTNNIDPIVNLGENPSATWKITLIYRLIQL